MELTGKVDANGIEVSKASMVRTYNVNMGGIDRVDQQLHNLRILPQVV